MEIIYREAVPSDAAALLEYLKAVGSESSNLSFGSEGLPMEPEQEEAFLENARSDPRFLMLNALDGDTIVGNASISGQGRARFAHRWHVAISVRRSHWGCGIGSELMRRLIAYAKENGAEIISLEVFCRNTRAIALYRKFGFEKFGTYRHFAKIGGEYLDADYMNLYL